MASRASKARRLKLERRRRAARPDCPAHSALRSNVCAYALTQYEHGARDAVRRAAEQVIEQRRKAEVAKLRKRLSELGG